jgi:hypothetical protein
MHTFAVSHFETFEEKKGQGRAQKVKKGDRKV